MSVLDRATNDALNAIIDLHTPEGVVAPWCVHCTALVREGAQTTSVDDVPSVDWPCPTMAAVLTVVQQLPTVQHRPEPSHADLIGETPLGQLGGFLSDGDVRD